MGKLDQKTIRRAVAMHYKSLHDDPEYREKWKALLAEMGADDPTPTEQRTGT